MVYAAPLTKQERRILGLIVDEGCSNQHICAELGIAEDTVKQHVSRILDKTGCRNRLDLTIKAYQERTVLPPPPDRFAFDCPHCGQPIKAACKAE